MIRNLCAVLGHKRDKHRVRPAGDDWHSNCLRCDAPLKRTTSGKWTLLAASEVNLVGSPSPKLAVDPFLRSGPTGIAVHVMMDELEQRGKFAQNPVNSIGPDAHDRRDFYVGRANEACLLAETADDQQIKVILLEMAVRYHSLANYHLERPFAMSAVG